MSGTSKIEWTDKTWNPTAGCDKVSLGCDNCYAERIAERFRGGPAFPHGFDLTLHPDRMNNPLKWKQPCRVFVNSMSDLFHPKIPEQFVAQVFATMSRASIHTFQVLTKRPRDMERLLTDRHFLEAVDDFRGAEAGDFEWPLPNVWLGVSVETQRYADLRIPPLLRTPAAIRFLSVEPMLGAINISASALEEITWCPTCEGRASVPVPGGGTACPDCFDDHNGQGWHTTHPIGWVIVGGESGPGARAMDPAWARALVAQCRGAGVAVFVKQLGDALWPARTHRDISSFPDELQIREYPTCPIPSGPPEVFSTARSSAAAAGQRSLSPSPGGSDEN